MWGTPSVPLFSRTTVNKNQIPSVSHRILVNFPRLSSAELTSSTESPYATQGKQGSPSTSRYAPASSGGDNLLSFARRLARVRRVVDCGQVPIGYNPRAKK